MTRPTWSRAAPEMSAPTSTSPKGSPTRREPMASMARAMQAAEAQGRQRGLLAGLDDAGVARRQRGRYLPGEQHDRVVEREDVNDDPERLIQHEVHLPGFRGTHHAALGATGCLAEMSECGHAPV